LGRKSQASDAGLGVGQTGLARWYARVL